MGKFDESSLVAKRGREVVNTLGESLMGNRWRGGGMNMVNDSLFRDECV